jgi:hypothetical protein
MFGEDYGDFEDDEEEEEEEGDGRIVCLSVNSSLLHFHLSILHYVAIVMWILMLHY